MKLYQDKYRIESARLQGYDYSSPGWYFITICTKNRVRYFGDIIVVDPAETPKLGVSAKTTKTIAKIQLSEPGILADKYWNEIPDHFPHVKLDEYQIMPDHIHGIIQITDEETPNSGVSIGKGTPNSGVPIGVETPGLGVTTRPGIGIIMNQFKRICTITTKIAGLKFAWQPRYHDHIIRDDDELERIRNYIKDNPKNWINDNFNIR